MEPEVLMQFAERLRAMNRAPGTVASRLLWAGLFLRHQESKGIPATAAATWQDIEGYLCHLLRDRNLSA